MNVRVTFALVMALASATAGAVQAQSKPMAAKGVKCGDSYIAAGQVCHKAPAPVTKGVKCGDSYIAAGQVCHKPTMATPTKPALMAPAKPVTTLAKTMAKPAMAKPAMAKPTMAAKGKKCGASYIPATAVCTKK